MPASLAEGFLSAGVAGFSLLLLIVALAAWRRVGGQKMLGLAGAFAVFFVKGVYYVYTALGPPQQSPAAVEALALDFGILLLLYVGTVR